MSVFNTTITVENLTDLSQVHMADYEWGSTAWVKMVSFAPDGALYALLKSTSLVTNGTTVVPAIVGSPIAGNAGARWVFVAQPAASPTSVDGFVVVRPIDGVTDDWPLLFSILQANAYKNIVIMLPGLNGEHFQCRSQQFVPSGTEIWATSGTIVDSHLAGVGLSDSVFYVNFTGLLAPIAVTANNVPGSLTVELAASPPGGVGSWFFAKASPSQGGTYQVVSIAGAGPYVVTVDRPIVYTLLVGDLATPCNEPPRNIRIVGNGMKIVGTGGGAYVAFVGSYQCEFTDIICDGSTALGCTTGGGFLFDTCGFDCTAERVTVIGDRTTVGWAGFLLIGETLRAYDLRSSRAVLAGVYVNDVFDAHLYGVTSYDNVGDGILWRSDVSADPSTGSGIHGGVLYSNGNYGIEIDSGTKYDAFEQITCKFNGVAGAFVSAANGAPVGIRFADSFFVNNTGPGFRDDVGVTQTTLTNCDVSGNTGRGIDCYGSITASGIVGRTGAFVTVLDGAEMFISSFEVVVSAPANTQAFDVQGSGRLHAQGGHLTMASTPQNAFLVQGATARVVINDARVTVNATGSVCLMVGATAITTLEDVSVDGTALGTSVGLNSVSGSTFRIGRRVKMDGLANPYNFNAGSLWSRSIDGHGNYPAGTNILVAGAPIVIAWPDIGASDRIYLTRTAAAPPAAGIVMPTVTKIVGTSFTITPDALDVGTYAYCID